MSLTVPWSTLSFHLLFLIYIIILLTVPDLHYHFTYCSWSTLSFHLLFLIYIIVSLTVPDLHYHFTYCSWSTLSFHLLFLIYIIISLPVPGLKYSFYSLRLIYSSHFHYLFLIYRFHFTDSSQLTLDLYWTGETLMNDHCILKNEQLNCYMWKGHN